MWLEDAAAKNKLDTIRTSCSAHYAIEKFNKGDNIHKILIQFLTIHRQRQKSACLGDTRTVLINKSIKLHRLKTNLQYAE